MLQRTDDWYKQREGRFTASQISRLLGKETLARTKQSIDTYAFEKAIETIYGREEDTYVSEDMQRGINQEPLAFALFKDLKGYEFLSVKEVGFYKFDEHAGASPDGQVSDNSNLEIKCPRRNKFFKIVANGINEVDFSYIAQMQMQMMCTNTEKSYFLNYYLENSIQYWHEIVIERDEELINLIKERVVMATEIKLEYMKKINQNSQW
tara:strand:+ start:464 stop:1087 length:624 start_codon:yes stop_codon:yes gene_type:complete